VKEVMKQYGIEEGEVTFLEAGTWTYGSERSAVVAMETSLRTRTVLEYGETRAYGQRLTDDELHYIHVFHLKGLKPDTTYHVKASAVDRTGGRSDTGDFTVNLCAVAGFRKRTSEGHKSLSCASCNILSVRCSKNLKIPVFSGRCSPNVS